MKRFCLVLVTLLISFFEMSAQTWREWTLDEALAYKGGTMFSLYEGVYRDPYPTYGRWHFNKTRQNDLTAPICGLITMRTSSSTPCLERGGWIV